MKAHRDEGGGILLLGKKKEAAGRSYRGRSRSSVLKCVFQVDSLVHIRIVNHTYTQFRNAPELPEHDYFLSRRASVFTRPESARDSVDIRLTHVLIYNGYIAQETLINTRARRSHPRRTMRFSFRSANGFFCVAA